MAELNKMEANRKRVAELLLDGKLTVPKDIDFFLDQFKKGEFALDDDGLMKAANLVKKENRDISKVSGWNNFWTYGRRNKKAAKIKKQADKIVKLESKREFDLVANAMKYKGMPIDDAGKESLKAEQDKIKANIADLNTKINGKGWHPFLKAQKRRQQKNLEKIDPAAKIDRISKEKDALSTKAVTSSEMISWFYKMQAKSKEKEVKKLENPNYKLQNEANKKALKIKALENQVAGTGFWNASAWLDKVELGFARRDYDKLQKKMVGKKLANDLKEQQTKLDAEIAALQATKVVTKTDKKRKDKEMATKLKLKATLDARIEKLDAKKELKETRIEAKFDKKEDKAMAIIMQKTTGIDKKNEKLNAITTEGKVRVMLLSQVSPDKRKELEAIINSNTEKAITDDNDFKKFLEEAGFKQEEISKLQDRIDSYENKKDKDNKKDEATEKEDETVAPIIERVSDENIFVGKEDEMATAEELKTVIKNEKITEVQTDLEDSAEYRARVTLAAVSSEGVTLVNTETIASLKEQGASEETIQALETAKKESMDKKAAEMAPERRKDLREVSLASKTMKMSDEEYKTFKDSGELAKNATPEQIKLMDNVRLDDKSPEYQALSKEDKEKVSKTKESVSKLDANQERKKIMEARGMVRDVSSNVTNSTVKKERQASQAVIKQNQANRQFR